MFTCCENKGFHITFANNVTISVQFGPYNYCEKRGVGRKLVEGFGEIVQESPRGIPNWESGNAEVAILLPDGKFYRISEHDDVIGWQTAEDVAKWIEVARKL